MSKVIDYERMNDTVLVDEIEKYSKMNRKQKENLTKKADKIRENSKPEY